jgi:hypothetical protein
MIFNPCPPTGSNVLYLYKPGDECVSKSGGWATAGYVGNTSLHDAEAPALSKNADSMVMSWTQTYKSGKSGILRAANVIDLTKWSTLKLKCDYNLAKGWADKSGYSRFYMLAPASLADGWLYTSPILQCAGSSESGGAKGLDVTYSLDVSAITGSRYVVIGDAYAYQNNTSTVTIYDVWLEK